MSAAATAVWRALHTTVVGDEDALSTTVVFEMALGSGRVVLSLPRGKHTVYLTDRRLDLIAALVHPPAGYASDEFIPDDSSDAEVSGVDQTS